MKHSFTKTILLVSVCAFAYGAKPAWCATNDVVTAGNTNETSWTISKEGHEIAESIAKAPEVILSMTNNVEEYTSMIYEKIKKCPTPEMRYRYFRELMESACQVDFETIKEYMPKTKETQNTMESFFKTGIYVSREDEIVGRVDAMCDRLGRLVEIISCCLASPLVSTSSAEQFEPYFLLIEKLKAEEQRLGKTLPSIKYISDYIESVAKRVERLFLFSYINEVPSRLPPLQDRVHVKARFEQVVGRPMHSAEEYRADSRRRMDEIIKRRKGGL